MEIFGTTEKYGQVESVDLKDLKVGDVVTVTTMNNVYRLLVRNPAAHRADVTGGKNVNLRNVCFASRLAPGLTLLGLYHKRGVPMEFTTSAVRSIEISVDKSFLS